MGQIGWESTKRIEILTIINTCLHNLITSSFLVVKQPLQVIRYGGRIKIEVRLLVGNKKIFGECSDVIVSILPSKEADKLNPELLKAHIEKENKGDKHKCGVINNNTGKFGNDKKKNVDDKSLVSFSNLQLKNIKRTGENDCVAEDLFSFVSVQKSLAWTCRFSYGLNLYL